MPRILGVDIPADRPTVISLQYLYGVGPRVARELCHKAGVDPGKALAAPAPKATAPGECPACGTGNDADAVFCKKCGEKMGALA